MPGQYKSLISRVNIIEKTLLLLYDKCSEQKCSEQKCSETWIFCLTAKWGCEALSAWHQIRGPHGLHGPITDDGAKCPGFIFRFEGRVFRLKGTLFEPTNRR